MLVKCLNLGKLAWYCRLLSRTDPHSWLSKGCGTTLTASGKTRDSGRVALSSIVWDNCDNLLVSCAALMATRVPRIKLLPDLECILLPQAKDRLPSHRVKDWWYGLSTMVVNDEAEEGRYHVRHRQALLRGRLPLAHHRILIVLRLGVDVLVAFSAIVCKEHWRGGWTDLGVHHAHMFRAFAHSYFSDCCFA